MTEPYLEVRNLRRVFDVSKPWLNRMIEGGERQFLTAVDDVSFAVAANRAPASRRSPGWSSASCPRPPAR
jgi:hypothetical protein